MTTAKAAVALMAALIDDEITDAVDAHRTGKVPHGPAQHWAWTQERDMRLERLEDVRKHLAALPPDAVIGDGR